MAGILHFLGQPSSNQLRMEDMEVVMGLMSGQKVPVINTEISREKRRSPEA